jgi:hypothetical protein
MWRIAEESNPSPPRDPSAFKAATDASQHHNPGGGYRRTRTSVPKDPSVFETAPVPYGFNNQMEQLVGSVPRIRLGECTPPPDSYHLRPRLTSHPGGRSELHIWWGMEESNLMPRRDVVYSHAQAPACLMSPPRKWRISGDLNSSPEGPIGLANRAYTS